MSERNKILYVIKGDTFVVEVVDIDGKIITIVSDKMNHDIIKRIPNKTRGDAMILARDIVGLKDI